MSSILTPERQARTLNRLGVYMWFERHSLVNPSRAVSLGVTLGAMMVMAIPVGLAMQSGFLEIPRTLGWSLAMGAVAASLGMIVAWIMEPLSWRGYVYRALREVQPLDKGAFLALLDDLERDGYDAARLARWLKQESQRLDQAQRAADQRRQLLEEEQVSEVGQFRQLLARRQTLR